MHQSIQHLLHALILILDHFRLLFCLFNHSCNHTSVIYSFIHSFIYLCLNSFFFTTAGHFVFVHLHEVRAFCLPDGYEILDSSLDDVKKCLSPTFSKQDIINLNGNSSLARDVHGVNYLPGFVGLNNLKNTDFVNVVLHALSHVTPVRDYFLQVRPCARTYDICVFVQTCTSTHQRRIMFLFLLHSTVKTTFFY